MTPIQTIINKGRTGITGSILIKPEELKSLLEAEKQMVIDAFDEGASKIVPMEGQEYYNQIS